MGGYEVIPADLHRDREAIVAVWARNLTANSLEEHRKKFAWNYLDNPSGSGRCWLLVSGKDGPVVGTAGIGMRCLVVKGVKARVGLASDYAVDKDHRSLQPALLIQRRLLSSIGGDIPLVYGLPNPKAAGIFQRLGYQTLGVVQRYVKVLRVGRYLRERAGVLRMMSRFAPVIDVALRATSAYTWRRGGGLRMRELRDFDDRFDDLWRRASPNLAMCTERTARFLRWRFGTCPLRDYRTLALLSSNEDRLFGYAVCYISNDQLVVADFLADPSEGSLDDLLGGVLSWSRRAGMSSVAVGVMNPGCRPNLRRLGFVPRPEEWPATVIARGASEVAPPPFPAWYFTPADEDYQ